MKGGLYYGWSLGSRNVNGLVVHGSTGAPGRALSSNPHFPIMAAGSGARNGAVAITAIETSGGKTVQRHFDLM
jgi:hypothetical protein